MTTSRRARVGYFAVTARDGNPIGHRALADGAGTLDFPDNHQARAPSGRGILVAVVDAGR